MTSSGWCREAEGRVKSTGSRRVEGFTGRWVTRGPMRGTSALVEVARGSEESLVGVKITKVQGMCAKTLEAHPVTGEGQEGCGEDQ